MEPGIDFQLAQLASRQHGVVSGRQLEALGLGRSAIRHRVQSGRLHVLHANAYSVGHRVVNSRGRWLGAVMGCGANASLSHKSAAALWDLANYASGRIDVTVPRSAGCRPEGLKIHRVKKLHENDWTVKDGIPVTTVSRTLLDLAECINVDALSRAFERADRLELLDWGELRDVIGRAWGRRGLRPLRAVMSEFKPIPAFTRSELERVFYLLCESIDIPTPSMNAWICDMEVDAYWREAQLVVEMDGWESHGSEAAFERDRERDGALQKADLAVMRITHRRLRNHREQVAEDLLSLYLKRKERFDRQFGRTAAIHA